MAEYYPLLAKAVGSLPNSTSESRRVVYERARKALIGQLKMLHPPVPEDDIERESAELDRAIQRLERELASGGVPAPPPAAAVPTPVKPAPAPILPPRAPRPASSLPAALPEGVATAERKPFAPLRPKMPKPKIPVAADAPGMTKAAGPETMGSVTPAAERASASIAERATSPLPVPPPTAASPAAAPPATESPPISSPSAATQPTSTVASTAPTSAKANGDRQAIRVPGNDPVGDGAIKARPEPQRPIAPQPRAADGSRQRVWIIPVGIGMIVLAVAATAYKLRDTRQTVARAKPTEQVAQGDSGKISERVGSPNSEGPAKPTDDAAPTSSKEAATDAATPAASPSPTSANPEVPVAHRAALLIEAPDEPNKVKTYLGTVVWKLNNVNDGPGDNVGLAVEADIDLPDDKMKASITFEKNTDSSLPASHTIKLRFSMQPGSFTGNIKQISVPQLRQEDSPSGEALAGVTVSVVPNSFLVGLSPGNAETVNIKQLKDLQWIDVPILLDSGKIAKLTFEKGPSGERDINEAVAAWQKS